MSSRPKIKSVWIYALLITALIPLTIWTHRPHIEWISQLSKQGTPAPALDPNSPTGYELGQRHFIGKIERGDSYRWIAALQQIPDQGLFSERKILSDTLPTGRPNLSSKLYLSWLHGITKVIQWTTGESYAIASESTAIWEPVISQILWITTIIILFAIRFGLVPAITASLFLLLFPPIFAQFLPGTLNVRNLAMLCSFCSISLLIPRPREEDFLHPRLTPTGAILAALALALDPSFGFPTVLIAAIVGIFGATKPQALNHAYRWAFTGASLTLVLWFIDQNPWNPAAGELRANHPLYAFAWLGLGFVIATVSDFRNQISISKRIVPQGILSLLLLLPLAYVQLKHNYLGWLYPSVALSQISSLNETVAYSNLFRWISTTDRAEILFLMLPGTAAFGIIGTRIISRKEAVYLSQTKLWTAILILSGVLLICIFRIRWILIFSLACIPIITTFSSKKRQESNWVLMTSLLVYFMGLSAWLTKKPEQYQRPSGNDELSIADTNALLYRGFSQWIANHNPNHELAVMAPPELSDSLIFHGGCSALMSTDWQSYPGQLAASRLLSAPEASEVEAVLSSIQLTHIVLPSWDPVLTMLVQKPTEAYKDTLYDRLQNWILPSFLRPIPYHLPKTPLYDDQKFAVFKITDPQEEALELSRLAEYFLEMKRIEPANLVGQSLRTAFPEDRNATIARALVYNQTQDYTKFLDELDRLEKDVKNDFPATSWDRRVQRAIVLALGKRWKLSKKEIEACIYSATVEDINELTPLQAFHFSRLAKQFKARFEDPQLENILKAKHSEYTTN